MKKLIGIGIASMMVMGLAVAASAAISDDWAVILRADLGGGTLSNATFGTKSTANDLYGLEDAGYGTGQPPYGYVYSSVKNTSDAVMQAKNDYKSTLTAANTFANAKTWDLYLAGSGNGTINLSGWILSSTASAIAVGSDIHVQLWQNGVKLTNAAKGFNEWNSSSVAKSQADPSYAGTFEYTGTPINLQLKAFVGPEATVVTPEPGSIVAMLSGLAGLAGYAIRRKK